MAYNFPLTVGFLETALANEYISESEMWSYHDPDITLRYENLGLQLDDLLITFGLGPVSLPRENVSHNRKGRHYREIYSAETRCYIWDRFKDEIEELGYEW